jgi:hypothetical protein
LQFDQASSEHSGRNREVRVIFTSPNYTLKRPRKADPVLKETFSEIARTRRDFDPGVISRAEKTPSGANL